jgi:PAS domain S-box-containing protein
MQSKEKTIDNLLRQLEETRRQLYEAQETIEAIRTGQVDALVVQSGAQHQLYTLQSADHAYRIFIEKMTEGAVTLNPEGIVLYANSQFGTMVGIALSRIIGLPFKQFLATESQPLFDELFIACWKGDCKGEIELMCGKHRRPVQLSLTRLDLNEGTSVSIILTDLTIQKATQKQLEDNNRELEQLNKILEASNHDLQQFASVASHDLQEPLRKIQMFTNLFKIKGHDKLTAEETLYLDKVIGSAGRMKALIIDILNYSRLSANSGEFVATDLNVVVRDLIEDYELLIKDKGAKVVYGQLPVLEANFGQMRQVFQNLISNSLKFSKTSVPPVIEVTGKYIAEKSIESKEQPDGPYCLLTVKDNGIGFEEKYISNIFSLFERLHSKDQYEGTGIGLAVTKKIIEKHNGLIHVKSTEGTGSEFSLILPVKQTQL